MTRGPNDMIIKQLEHLAKALGPWRDSLVLGGGVALIVYDRCMARTNAKPVGTADLDFLIPRRPLVPANSAPLSTVLKDLGFKIHTKDLGIPPVQSFVKESGDVELEVEFLTDDRTRSKTQSVPIEGAQIVAQPLSYLEMSLQSVTAAILPSNTEIRIVTPEAWVFHKGLTFPRRKPGSAKQQKDLYGMWFVLTQMGDFSTAATLRLGKLQAKQPASWKRDFGLNLSDWVANAIPKDWDRLIAQDPEQRLTEAAFRGLVKRIGA